MTLSLLDGEEDFVAAVLADLTDDGPKLVYADWLEEHDPKRAQFLRALVVGARTLRLADIPQPGLIPREWRELMGYGLIRETAGTRMQRVDVADLRDWILRWARPALRVQARPNTGPDEPFTVSKTRGRPATPRGFAWPSRGDCRTIAGADPPRADEPARFLRQINLADVAGTFAAAGLPSRGVLSFFGFYDRDLDHEHAFDRRWSVGLRIYHFPEPDELVAASPPGGWFDFDDEEEGLFSRPRPLERLTFEQTLNLPPVGHGGRDARDGATPSSGPSTAPYAVLRAVQSNDFLGPAIAPGDDPRECVRRRTLFKTDVSRGRSVHAFLDESSLLSLRFDEPKFAWSEPTLVR